MPLKLKKNAKNNLTHKYFELIIKFLFLVFFNFLTLLKNSKYMEKPSKKNFFFIVCLFGKQKLNKNHKIRKYFLSLEKYLPGAKIVFATSEFTKIDPILLDHKNINISIERYGNDTINDIRKKYKFFGAKLFYYNALRYSFYNYYLKKHSEIKYVAVSDDDTLFFRDPLILLTKESNSVHFMEDIYPFSNTKDGNYIWTNTWIHLNDSIKQKCGFMSFNRSLLSNDIKNIIPLNVGMMIGSSKNIIKISELIFLRFICPGLFPNNAEQGLLNYLYLSGELKKLGISILRHNIFNDSLISCPNLLPIKNYTQQINSNNLIAIHHYQYLKSRYIKQSPIIVKEILNHKF